MLRDQVRFGRGTGYNPNSFIVMCCSNKYTPISIGNLPIAHSWLRAEIKDSKNTPNLAAERKEDYPSLLPVDNLIDEASAQHANDSFSQGYKEGNDRLTLVEQCTCIISQHASHPQLRLMSICPARSHHQDYIHFTLVLYELGSN